MKKKCVLAVMSMFGLSVSIAIAEMPPSLNERDCQLFFPLAHSAETTRALSSGVLYTEAWEQGSWGPPEEFLGYVFMIPVQHQGKTIDLMAGVTRTGAIIRVCVRGIDGVDKNFLAQFRGKSSTDSFDLARKPEDLLVIPAKIKAMQGNRTLSESIAHGVKEIALSANKVTK